MSVTQLPHFTRSGLPGIELIPFGVHACHAYADRDELVAALVPYFMAGLRGNERCLWITAPPLPASEAIEALRESFDGVDAAMQGGALRVLDFDQWYETSGALKGVDVIQVWLDEEERALAEGYDGLRITGNVTFLKPGDWATFIEYEQAVTARFSGRRIVALCSYALAQCDERQLSEVVQAHHCAFERPGGGWQVAVPSRPRVT